MIRHRWVDVAVGAVLLLGVAILVSAGVGDRAPVALGGLALLGAAYLWVRPVVGTDDFRRFPWSVGLIAVAIALVTWASPALATVQVIAYPLVWILGPGRRAAVWGSCAVGVGMFVGFAGGLGFTTAAAREAAIVAALSAGFSIAMGWWMSAVAAYGEQRARLLAELTSAHQQVEALSREKGAGEERERLAREIHDTLAQTLAGLVILAEQAGRRARSGDVAGATATAGRLETVAREALDEARALVARTAAVPGDQALEAAVERLAARFRADTGWEIVVTAPARAEPLDRDAQVVVLRCLQEALANARKHAAATRVAVEVRREPDGGVRLSVADDGRGFDPASPALGYGLDGIRDRVSLASGTVEVASAPGEGTTLTVVLPAASERVGGAA